MAEENIKFTIPLDDNGFVTLKCPFCAKHFKITGTDANDYDIYELFCPYCGLVTEPSTFITDDVKEKAVRLAENYMSEMLNGFMNDMERSFRGNKNISFKKGKEFTMNETKTIIEAEDMSVYKLSCCNRGIKAILVDDDLYCPFCGGITHGDNN